jgi:hypothetical protein
MKSRYRRACVKHITLIAAKDDTFTKSEGVYCGL